MIFLDTDYVDCDRCNGEGWTHHCIDDLCQAGPCIHGDNYECPDCNGTGTFRECHESIYQ